MVEFVDKPKLASGIKLGVVAVTSALAGGLAAAWWHRRTLAKLQNPILSIETHNSKSPELSEEDSDFRGY